MWHFRAQFTMGKFSTTFLFPCQYPLVSEPKLEHGSLVAQVRIFLPEVLKHSCVD